MRCLDLDNDWSSSAMHSCSSWTMSWNLLTREWSEGWEAVTRIETNVVGSLFARKTNAQVKVKDNSCSSNSGSRHHILWGLAMNVSFSLHLVSKDSGSQTQIKIRAESSVTCSTFFFSTNGVLLVLLYVSPVCSTPIDMTGIIVLSSSDSFCCVSYSKRQTLATYLTDWNTHNNILWQWALDSHEKLYQDHLICSWFSGDLFFHGKGISFGAAGFWFLFEQKRLWEERIFA